MIGRFSRFLRHKWWWWHIGHAIAQAEDETARFEAAMAQWRAHRTGLPPPMPEWMHERVMPTARQNAVDAAMWQRIAEERREADEQT